MQLSMQICKGAKHPRRAEFAAFTMASTLRVVMSPYHRYNVELGIRNVEFSIGGISDSSVIPLSRFLSLRYSSCTFKIRHFQETVPSHSSANEANFSAPVHPGEFAHCIFLLFIILLLNITVFLPESFFLLWAFVATCGCFTSFVLLTRFAFLQNKKQQNSRRRAFRNSAIAPASSLCCGGRLRRCSNP